MPEFSSFTGRLVEVHRFINVPMRWSEQYPARERRELWIAHPDGSERKLVVHSRAMPARHGHMVNVLTWGDLPLALCNLSTGDRVSFVEVDPPLLWVRRDAVRTLSATAVISLLVVHWCAVAWLALALPGVWVLVSGLIGLRWFGRLRLQARARAWLQCSVERLRHPHLRRVK